MISLKREKEKMCKIRFCYFNRAPEDQSGNDQNAEVNSGFRSAGTPNNLF